MTSIPQKLPDITLGSIESSAPQGLKEAAIIKSVFEECDTEGATDKNGKVVGDGKLTGKERTNFLGMLKKALPTQLYNEIVDFFSKKEAEEDEENVQQETLRSLDEEDDIENTRMETKKRVDKQMEVEKQADVFGLG